MPKSKGNLGSLGDFSGPKKRDPDEIPEGYNPMVWRLSRYFKTYGEEWNHFIRQNAYIIYGNMDDCIKYSSPPKNDDLEEFYQEVIRYLWNECYLLKSNPDFFLDNFISPAPWREAERVIKQRRSDKRTAQKLKAMAKEQREADKDKPLTFPDRSDPRYAPKPRRTGLPLGVPRPTDSLELSPRAKEFLKEVREKKAQEESE